MKKDKRLLVAQLGRTVGLRGDVKLHLYTDFPEQFTKGAVFQSARGDLTVASVNLKRGTVRFENFENIDDAKALTNLKLYVDETDTKTRCKLEAGQYFWFDIEGCDVFDGSERLGFVEEIQRMAGTDYLSIKTDDALVEQGLSERFLIPYVPRYIVSVDVDAKRIETRDAKAILEAS